MANLDLGLLTVASVKGGDISLSMSRKGSQWLEGLDVFGTRARNLKRPLDEWGRYIVEKIVPLQFERQGTPRRWARLSPDYAAWKRKHYGSLPILVLSGKMRAGFSWTATARTLKVENKVKRRGGRPYWIYHQFGTSRMPQRAILQMRAEDREQLRRIILNWVLNRETAIGT